MAEYKSLGEERCCNITKCSSGESDVITMGLQSVMLEAADARDGEDKRYELIYQVEEVLC